MKTATNSSKGCSVCSVAANAAGVRIPALITLPHGGSLPPGVRRMPSCSPASGSRWQTPSTWGVKGRRPQQLWPLRHTALGRREGGAHQCPCMNGALRGASMADPPSPLPTPEPIIVTHCGAAGAQLCLRQGGVDARLVRAQQGLCEGGGCAEG